MILHTGKGLNSKNFREKKFKYKAGMTIQKENLISKPKKFWLEKGLIFFITLIQAVVSKSPDSFTKYKDPGNISLH